MEKDRLGAGSGVGPDTPEEVTLSAGARQGDGGISRSLPDYTSTAREERHTWDHSVPATEYYS